MTCIAYRAGVLAGDGRETMQNSEDESWYRLRDNCVKVFKFKDGSLFGAAHASEDIERLYIHLMKKPWSKKFPKNLNDVIGLRVTTDGKIWLTEGALWMPWDTEYFAVGSGALCALSAMDAGADAKQAVAIACGRDLWCGGKITTVSLK